MTRLIRNILSVACVLTVCPAAAGLEINDDGRELINEATEAWGREMKDQPVVTDKAITRYVNGILERLEPEGLTLPDGVTLSATVIESSTPGLYAYIDGHIILQTGLLYAVENEAQLAGVLSHEVALVSEGYYVGIYQEIKAAERKERRSAALGALFGGLMDVAVDYAVELEGTRHTEKLMAGEATYTQTMRNMAAVHAAHGAYRSMKDVIDSIPVEDEDGNRIDPRLQFEPVADAKGMQYLALAGYDAAEAGKGWEKIAEIHRKLVREQNEAMGQMAEQIRAMQAMMEASLRQMQQALGSSGLVKTVDYSPAARSEFVSSLVTLEEVQKAQKQAGSDKREDEYKAFLGGVLIPRALQALEDERYDEAKDVFQTLYDRDIRSVEIVYGLAKSRLGDFAFGASEGEKKKTEVLYKEAIALDGKFALAHRGLGELYDDWERYADAAKSFKEYVAIEPDAEDRERIERKIRTLERKASR